MVIKMLEHLIRYAARNADPATKLSLHIVADGVKYSKEHEIANRLVSPGFDDWQDAYKEYFNKELE